jgi:hypothetical protein
VNPTTKEKLDWAEDIIRDWHSEDALQAACEYLYIENAVTDDVEVLDRIAEIIEHAKQRGLC